MFFLSGREFLRVSFQTPEAFSPQNCNVKIVQFLNVVKWSHLRVGIRRDVVPDGDVRSISRSPRRVKLRVSRTWTCSKKFILLGDMFTVSVSSDGIALEWTRIVQSSSNFFFVSLPSGWRGVCAIEGVWNTSNNLYYYVHTQWCWQLDWFAISDYDV